MGRVNVWSAHIYHFMQRQWNTENLILTLSQLSAYHIWPVFLCVVIYGDSAFCQASYLNSRQLGRGKHFLESAGSWLFSAQNSLHTKSDTFWGDLFVLVV